MFKRILFVCIALAAAVSAQAHFIWLELPADAAAEVRMRFSEQPGERTRPTLQEKAAPMAVRTAGGDALKLSVGEAYLSGPVAEDAAAVLGSLDYGVLDRSSEGRGKFLLVYHARGVRTAEEAAKPSGLPIDVTAKVEGNTVSVQVLRDGKPVPAAEVFATLPGVEEEKEGVTDEQGHASFSLNGGGWLGIRAMVPEEHKGESNGEAYDLVRHYSTLTVPLPGSAEATSTP